MHISGYFTKKANIHDKKANIDKKLDDLTNKLSNVTTKHINIVYSKYSKEDYFTRLDVEHLTGLKSTRAHELIKLLISANIVEPVKGHGKGKYKFINQ